MQLWKAEKLLEKFFKEFTQIQFINYIQLRKKVAPTTNEKITKDAALQEEIEKLKEYVPNDEKDSDKKQKYLEEIPEVINHALDGLTKLAVASPVTCERQISIDQLEGFSSPLLPTVGRIDFDYGSINNHEFGNSPSLSSIRHRKMPFLIRLLN